jgi:pimeloyl-ACP methyl ester carboxylesterase
MAFAVLTAPPAFFRGRGDETLKERPITIEATFTPSEDGYESTDFYYVYLVRPPVVMVHGLWGNGGDFADLDTELYNNGFMYLYRPSYNNSASFATNDWVLPHLINNILTNLRTEGGFACAKVDIVAHSMGGLLAKRLDPAFAQKNVRKIITIGTPYSGSPLADELWEALLYDPIRTYSLENLINLFISHNTKSITGGAIKDLRCYNNLNIPVSTKIQGVDCRNVIVGLRDGALWDPGLNVYVTGLMIMTRKWTPEAAHDFIFGPGTNSDWVVSENSQQYDADMYQVIPVHWHCSETQDADFKSIVLATLNQPAQISGNISSGLVIGEPYTISSHKVSHIEKGIYPLSSEPKGTVEIVAPLAGGTCTAGQSITISVVGTGDTTHAGVFAFFGSFSWADIVQLPWAGDVNVPSNSVGSSAKIYAIGLDADMNMTDQNEVDLVLDTNVVLADIFFGFGNEWTFDFKTFPQQSHEFQLYPMGVFSDSSEHPLSVLSDEVFYWSDDETVASVDSNGLITVHSRGITWIEVYYAGSMTYLKIEVDADIGDFDLNGYVDFSDFAILAGQWLQPPVIPSADIAQAKNQRLLAMNLFIYILGPPFITHMINNNWPKVKRKDASG